MTAATRDAPQYAAFIRGINVGGRAIVSMTDLQAAFQKAGGRNVSTYINSGNVLFEAPARRVPGIVKKARTALGRGLGREPGIAVRPVARLEALVQENPFRGVRSVAEARLYVAFLSGKPGTVPALPLVSPSEALEVVRIDGAGARADVDVLIVSRPGKDGMYGFPNGFIEGRFGVAATTRNWSTVIRLLERAKR